MSVRKKETIDLAGFSEPMDGREHPQGIVTRLRPYQPPTVKVFPVAELVRSGGGSATDAFGAGHVG